MHILFFSHYFPPEVNAPANRIYEHARRWVAAGHRVTVVTCAPNCPHGVIFVGYKNRWLQRETMAGIQVLRVWTYMAANRGFWRRTLNYVSFMVSACLAALFFVRRPDIVVATSPQFFCGWAGALVSFFLHAPFVLEVRDIWPESIEAVGAARSPLLLSFLSKLERLLYRQACLIITVGEGYRQKLMERGVAPEKLAVIPNGISFDSFKASGKAESLRVSLGLEGKFMVSYVGTVGMAHGLEVVLEAAAQLKDRKDIVFLIAGDGAARTHLEKSSRRRGLTNVTFTGRLPHGWVPDLLSLSAVSLVHLRRKELFKSVLPSKIFEAMAMARPLILGVEGHAAGVVRRANAGLCIPPENAQALVDAVRYFYDQPEEARRLGRNGLAYVRENCDRNQLASRYLEMLLEVHQREPAARPLPSPE